MKLMNRRQLLAAGTGMVGAVSALSFGLNPVRAQHSQRSVASRNSTSIDLPVKEIEQIMQAPGSVMNGILDINIKRNDLDLTLRVPPGDSAIPFGPAWQNNGDFFFQSLGNGLAIMNADFGGLLPREIDPFIDKLLQGGIINQALHQHLYDIQPQEVYFVHMRAVGDPLQIARALIEAVKVTGTPLPQTKSSNPTTTLPTQQIGQIIGVPATVGESGVVSLAVPRRETITLAGFQISPFLNIATPISFEPLANGQAAAVADFGLLASEVNNVFQVMRQQGWVIGCLYNQETDEQPQLYFSHQAKVGDAMELAREIRRGLDCTNSEGSSSVIGRG